MLGQSHIRGVNRQLYNALWLLERAFGEPRAKRYFGRVRAKNLESIRADMRGHGDAALRPVERREDLSADAFVRDYLATGTPVVFPAVAKSWGCCRKWSPRFFAETCGDLSFWVLPPSVRDLADRGLGTAVEVTVREVMTKIEEGDDSYARFLPLLREYPELLNDLDVSWFRARRGTGSVLGGQFQLFVGSAGSDTMMHAAMANNLFLQVQGRKRWRLFPPTLTPALQPVANKAPYFVSLADADQREDETHPLFRYAAGYEVELTPGDVLYNPPFYWHQVENPTASIGLGYRWLGLPSIASASLVQTILTLAAVDPPFWKQDLVGFVKSGAAGWVEAHRRRRTPSRSA